MLNLCLPDLRAVFTAATGNRTVAERTIRLAAL